MHLNSDLTKINNICYMSALGHELRVEGLFLEGVQMRATTADQTVVLRNISLVKVNLFFNKLESDCTCSHSLLWFPLEQQAVHGNKKNLFVLTPIHRCDSSKTKEEQLMWEKTPANFRWMFLTHIAQCICPYPGCCCQTDGCALCERTDWPDQRIVNLRI